MQVLPGYGGTLSNMEISEEYQTIAQKIVCGQTGQRSCTRLQDRPSFPGNGVVGHPRSHGGMAGQTHRGHESVCHTCQVCYHSTWGFVSGLEDQGKKWCSPVLGSNMEGLNVLLFCCHIIIPGV